MDLKEFNSLIEKEFIENKIKSLEKEFDEYIKNYKKEVLELYEKFYILNK